MKLQISFDIPDLDKACQIAQEVTQYCDIIELGTVLIHKYGAIALQSFKKSVNDTPLLVDTKIVDRGRDSVKLFAQEGADWMTVMAGTSKDVIHASCTLAHELGKKVMLDLLDTDSHGQTALEAKSLGADALLFHQPYDASSSSLFLDQWDMIRGNTDLPIYVSAKITRDSLDQILNIKPDGIIIGSAIVSSDNPVEEAQYFCDKIKAA